MSDFNTSLTIATVGLTLYVLGMSLLSPFVPWLIFLSRHSVRYRPNVPFTPARAPIIGAQSGLHCRSLPLRYLPDPHYHGHQYEHSPCDAVYDGFPRKPSSCYWRRLHGRHLPNSP